DQAVSCAKKFNIRHEILETQEIQKRYPQFSVTNERGYFEYETGFLRPELCVDAQLQLAQTKGAIVQTGEKATSIVPQENSGVCVQTDHSVYAAESLIVTAGPWISEFLPASYRGFFKVYRQVMYWFNIEEEFRLTFLPGRFPIFIWIFGKDREFGFYGFPTLNGKTIKMASEQFAVVTVPDEVDRAVTRTEEKAMYKNYIMGRIPGLSDVCSEAVSCLYTTTPDSNFVIDFHPENNRIVVASPCSGHGFKHSAAIGEVLSDLVIDGNSKIDISSFSMKRFNISSNSSAREEK
ncbi:MAG TPA: N-methyl-L-tryptophan oxidase, partial [Candidatus Udaeobacter sp.]|nr:N-methyl-L-tryptophan oxidase [Candidatus Udaeobacter sp.]